MPMTFTIYDDGGVNVLARTTTTITVPYRPSASTTQCIGDNAGKWYNSKDRTCYNGFPNLVTVDMSQASYPTAGSGVTLPTRVIWSVQYDTTSSGYHPLGNVLPCSTLLYGCGYDTLNVGAYSYPNAPFAGTDLDPGAVFFNGNMQTQTATGDFWTGLRPLGAIYTR